MPVKDLDAGRPDSQSTRGYPGGAPNQVGVEGTLAEVARKIRIGVAIGVPDNMAGRDNDHTDHRRERADHDEVAINPAMAQAGGATNFRLLMINIGQKISERIEHCCSASRPRKSPQRASNRSDFSGG
jgi:hypothetical protein